MGYHLDPTNAAFAAVLRGQPAPHQMGGYAEARQSLEDLQKQDSAKDIATEAIQFDGNYGPTEVKIFRLRSLLNKKIPAIFYTHGGGWIMGGPKSFAPLIEDLARRTGATIVFPDYTRAPEKETPFPIEQCYEVLEYVVGHGSEHSLLVETIALAGDSAGGQLAIAMMQLSLLRHLPAGISHIVLWAPVTTTDVKHLSYETYKDAPFLPVDALDWMISTFLPNREDRKTALSSPLTHLPDDTLRQFAPTTIFLSTIDPLVDEGASFGKRLQDNGVDAAVIKAEGQMHAFCLLKVLRDGPTARAIMELAASRLRKSLGLECVVCTSS